MAKVDANNIIDAIKSVKQQDIAKFVENQHNLKINFLYTLNGANCSL